MLSASAVYPSACSLHKRGAAADDPRRVPSVRTRLKVHHAEDGKEETGYDFYPGRELPKSPNAWPGVDWVVIPSVWWENSPMVIQEAFSYGRPVIGSDIGGVNRSHVQVSSANAWGNMLLSLGQRPRRTGAPARRHARPR